GHDFILTERPGPNMAYRPDHGITNFRAMRLSTIFDDEQIMLFRQGHNAIHITRPAAEMNRDYRLGFRRNDLADCARADIPAIGFDISENRGGSNRDHR